MRKCDQIYYDIVDSATRPHTYLNLYDALLPEYDMGTITNHLPFGDYKGAFVRTVGYGSSLALLSNYISGDPLYFYAQRGFSKSHKLYWALRVLSNKDAANLTENGLIGLIKKSPTMHIPASQKIVWDFGKQYTYLDITASAMNITTSELFDKCSDYFYHAPYPVIAEVKKAMNDPKSIIDSVYTLFAEYYTYASMHKISKAFPIILAYVDKIIDSNALFAVRGHALTFKQKFMRIFSAGAFGILPASYMLKEYAKENGKFKYPPKLLFLFIDGIETANCGQAKLYEKEICANIEASATNYDQFECFKAAYNLVSLFGKLRSAVTETNNLGILNKFIPNVNNTLRESEQYPAYLCDLCDFLISFLPNLDMPNYMEKSVVILAELQKNESVANTLYEISETLLCKAPHKKQLPNIFKVLHYLGLSAIEFKLVEKFPSYKKYLVEAELSC